MNVEVNRAAKISIQDRGGLGRQELGQTVKNPYKQRVSCLHGGQSYGHTSCQQRFVCFNIHIGVIKNLCITCALLTLHTNAQAFCQRMNPGAGDDIKAKLELLVSRMKHIQEQRDVLLQENARLAESMEQLKKELAQERQLKKGLTEELTALQDPEIADKEEGKRMEIREKIRELAEEVDRCITLLNQG